MVKRTVEVITMLWVTCVILERFGVSQIKVMIQHEREKEKNYHILLINEK